MKNTKLIFRWYDFYIGWYYDRQKCDLYIFPIPMCGIKVQFSKRYMIKCLKEYKQSEMHKMSATYMDNGALK